MALVTDTLPGMPGGMNQALPAQELDDTQARWIQDGLVDLPGIVRSRGPVIAVADAAQAANKAAGLAVTADPNNATRFAMAHGDNTNGYLGLLSDDRSTMVDVAWPNRIQVAPPTNPFSLFHARPASLGGTWIGTAEGYDSGSTYKSAAFWYGGNKANYSTGTAAFTGGGVTVTGTGTSWATNASPGMFLFAEVQNTAVAKASTYFGSGVKTLIGVVKTVNSDTSLTLVAPSPYASTGTSWAEVSPTAVNYELRSLRGFQPRIIKGLVTCSTTTKTVTGGNTKWIQQGMPNSVESGRSDNFWNLYRLSDGNWIGRVDKANSDTSLDLIANAAISLVDEPYVALRGDGDWSVGLASSGEVGWLTSAYAERQWYALGSQIFFSDTGDMEGVDISTYAGDYINIPSTVSVVEPIRSIMPAYNALVVLKETETYAIYGNSPSSFSVRKLEDDGVFHTMAVQPYGGGVIWPGRNGIYLYDGVNTNNLVSDNLGQFWKDMVRTIDFSSYRVWSMLARNHYFLFFEQLDLPVVPRKGSTAQTITSITVVINMTTRALTLMTGTNIRGTCVLPQTDTREAWFLVNGADTNRATLTQGKTAAGASAQELVPDTQYLTKMTATATGFMKSAVWRLDGNGSGGNPGTVRAALYADDAGEPGALLGASEEVTVAAAAAAADVGFTFVLPPYIESGEVYWIGLHAGLDSDGVRGFHDTVASIGRTLSQPYASGEIDPWDTATDSTTSDDFTAYMLYAKDVGTAADAETLFALEGLDTLIADGGSPVDHWEGPDLYVETKKFDVGDGLRLKRFKQFSVWYLAQDGDVSIDTVTGLNEIGKPLVTVLPSSVLSWAQLGTQFVSWDALAEQYATWNDIIQAVFLPKRARFSKKTQYFSVRLYRLTRGTSRIQFGPFGLGYKTLRPGRVS